MHTPVLLEEVIKYLNIRSGSVLVDATLNGGGHVAGILEKYPDVKILGIEFDPDIFAKFKASETASRIIAVNDSYVHIKDICKRYGLKPSGVLFDLGVSSHHYESKRGFSFQKNEKLDMRFNPNEQSLTAYDIVNGYMLEEIEQTLSEYGEEEFADRISKGIINSRRIKPIETTDDLVQIIKASVPGWYNHRKINPATKTFQALRMAVNSEPDSIKEGLNGAIDVLEPSGRMVVISFHGVEDKLAREVIKTRVLTNDIKWVTKSTIKPSWDEIKTNPRARSAKMKIVERM